MPFPALFRIASGNAISESFRYQFSAKLNLGAYSTGAGTAFNSMFPFNTTKLFPLAFRGRDSRSPIWCAGKLPAAKKCGDSRRRARGPVNRNSLWGQEAIR